MPWWTWLALAFFVVVVIATATFALFAYRRLRGLRSRGDVMRADLELVALKAERLEQRLEHVQERSELVQQHLDRLNASLERLSVLTWALGDARKGLTRIRSVYLRK